MQQIKLLTNSLRFLYEVLRSLTKKQILLRWLVSKLQNMKQTELSVGVRSLDYQFKLSTLFWKSILVEQICVGTWLEFFVLALQFIDSTSIQLVVYINYLLNAHMGEWFNWINSIHRAYRVNEICSESIALIFHTKHSRYVGACLWYIWKAQLVKYLFIWNVNELIHHTHRMAWPIQSNWN